MYQKIRGANGKRFEETQVIDWFIQMALAIYYMHENRILHRDLKTQNLFLTGGKIKLGDFGISKVLDEKQQLTNTMVGTPYYMSPEQFRFKPYSYKTDIWALGCMLYEMCNMRHAFEAQNVNALSVKILKGNYPPVNSLYSKPLRELVGTLLNIDPKNRPTVVDILKLPFLRKRLMNYVQSCLKEENNDALQIATLKQQAEKLGLEFMDSIPRHYDYASTPNSNSKSNSKSERNSAERNSARLSNKSSKELLDIKALENRKKILEKELDWEMHEKKKMQEELKKIDPRSVVEKREEILERERERRKRIISQDKSRSSSSPNLALMKKQVGRESAINVSTEISEESKQKTPLVASKKESHVPRVNSEKITKAEPPKPKEVEKPKEVVRPKEVPKSKEIEKSNSTGEAEAILSH